VSSENQHCSVVTNEPPEIHTTEPQRSARQRMLMPTTSTTNATFRAGDAFVVEVVA
jgi:hypothetical protein